jgi:hypothetical protein
MSDAIPFEKLEEGLQKIQRNVKLLVDYANLLFDNGKFYHFADIFHVIRNLFPFSFRGEKS